MAFRRCRLISGASSLTSARTVVGSCSGPMRRTLWPPTRYVSLSQRRGWPQGSHCSHRAITRVPGTQQRPLAGAREPLDRRLRTVPAQPRRQPPVHDPGDRHARRREDPRVLGFRVSRHPPSARALQERGLALYMADTNSFDRGTRVSLEGSVLLESRSSLGRARMRDPAWHHDSITETAMMPSCAQQ